MIKRIEGNYLHGTISVDGDIITVDRSRFGRPNGVGKIEGNKATVKFPDHRSFFLQYDEREKTLYLDGKKSGIKWIKTNYHNEQNI